jgi:hypothetical protein
MIFDLRTAISILTLDGFEYCFPHRSMQEYFTALFINQLAADKKETAYINIKGILEKSSNDHSFNLWSLCYELDEDVFLPKIILPTLKSILKQLQNKVGDDLVKRYFKIIDPYLLFHVDKEKEKTGLYIFKNYNFENSLLEFCLTNYPTSLIELFLDKEESDKIMSYYMENDYKESDFKYDIKDINESKIYLNMILKTKIYNYVENKRTQIKEKIALYEVYLANKNTSLDELLKINNP